MKKSKNIFNKILGFFNKKSYSGLFQSRNLKDDLNWTRRDYLKQNEISLYVNKAIKKRAEKVAQTDWVIKKGDKVIDEKNEWLDLINKPNDFFSGAEFWELYQRYKDITGSAFIWKESGIGKVPKALHLLRPDLVEVKIVEGAIVGYKFSKHGGGFTNYKPEEIIYSFYPDPINQLMGESIMKAGARIIDTGVQIDEYQNSILKNGGKIEGVFKVKSERITEEQLDDIKTQYQQKYGAARKSGEPLFLSGDMDYENMGLTPSELNYLETKKMTLNDIVIMTGVPKSILGSVDDVKYSNSETSEITFMKHTIKPLVMNLSGVLNHFLLPEGEELDFIDPVPENKEEIRKDIETGREANALTINEIREKLGFDPINGGDVIYAPINQMPLDGVSGNKSIKSIDKIVHPLQDKAFRDKYGQVKEKQLSQEEKRVEETMARYFKKQKNRLIEKIEAGQGNPQLSEIFNKDMEMSIAETIIRPLLEIVLFNAGSDAMNFTKTFMKVQIDEFIIDVNIRSWIEERIGKFSESVVNTTFSQLEAVFQTAFDSDNPREALIKGLQDKYAIYETSRAKTIARTETHGAFQKGNYEGYKQSELPIKIWVTVGDANVRDSHGSVDGEEVAINDYFSNGLKFPGDPRGSAENVINCRCSI